MNDFEELAFAGLPHSSHTSLWVRHNHTGRDELHFIIPRQEVHTGKSFNAFPPNWQKKYDILRDKYNYKYGWARPDDPRRARPVQPGKQALIDADIKRKGKEAKVNIKENVTNILVDLIHQGKIHKRADILETLRSMGYTFNRISQII